MAADQQKRSLSPAYFTNRFQAKKWHPNGCPTIRYYTAMLHFGRGTLLAKWLQWPLRQKVDPAGLHSGKPEAGGRGYCFLELR